MTRRRDAAVPAAGTAALRRPERRRLAGWLGAVLGASSLGLWVRLGPLPDVPRDTSPIITDRHGVVLYEPLAANGTRREWIAEVPENVARATIAAEDRRFETHPGVDPIAVARAVVHDVRRLRVVEGGSTITQQVAKMMLGNPPRTFAQKVREAVVALRLEHRYNKREILALYVNLAPYGEQTTGIVRASRRYFGCAPEELTVAQAAWLAALPQRPSAPRRALARQRAILARMNAPREAREERLTFSRTPPPMLAPHFVQRVLGRVGEPVPHARIVTSLDAGLQRAVTGIIAAERANLLAHGAHSVAVVVLDNRTGEFLAYEGSGDYFGDEFGGAIDGVTTLRQPGSALKPFTYALAFEQGFTPATVLADVPQHFPTAEEGVVYTPRNYDGTYRGPLRARLALAGSENVPAVALLSKIGAPSLLRLLRGAGFRDLQRTADYYGLGLTLGDAEVTLEQLVKAYAIFARGGDGIVSPRTAFWITDILSDPAAREYIFGSGGSLDFDCPVAVKTGTSQAYRDNWTVGYTRAVTVGVWVGNFDRVELRDSTGVTGAGPIFHAVMLAANRARDASIVDRPPDLERQPVCALSGARPSTSCPTVDNEWLSRDAAVEFCAWHHEGYIAWPAEYREWAGGQRSTVNGQPPTANALRITNPANDATYLIDPTLRREFQSLRLRANASARWTVDGRPVSREWPLAPGKHVIVAEGAAGRDAVTVTVR
ncbi:MAG: transglycosylase domain-containing protein [Acidobacteriota bacterium]